MVSKVYFIPDSYIASSIDKPLTKEELAQHYDNELIEGIAGFFLTLVIYVGISIVGIPFFLKFLITMPINFVIFKVRDEVIISHIGEEKRKSVEELRLSPQEHISKPLLSYLKDKFWTQSK